MRGKLRSDPHGKLDLVGVNGLKGFKLSQVLLYYANLDKTYQTSCSKEKTKQN